MSGEPRAETGSRSSSGVAADRRSSERRRPRRVVGPDESWFGSSPVERDPAAAWLPDTPERAPGAATPADRDAAEAMADAAAALDDDEPGRPTATVAGASGASAAFDRIFGVFVAARAALGVALLVAVVAGGLFGLRPTGAVAALSLAYAALAIVAWGWPRPWPAVRLGSSPYLRRRPWLATIGVDLVVFLALHAVAPGASLNYVALLVLPVLMGGVLTPRPTALATAAATTLVLLLAAWLAVLGGADGTAQLTQAGLAGTGFFVITVLASELAGRLAREELAARGSREMARRQAQLNRLVIEEMQDGVLVVDRRGRVRAANPAARRLLAPSGLARPAPFQLRGVAAWQALVRTVERAFVEATWPEAGRDVTLDFEGDRAAAPRTLRVRVRFTAPQAQAAEEFCVLFLEDVRNMQARSRQEKLASMGRISAGIAHEIRNPLAAISQANALLSEDVVDPAQRRLTQMVGANVERLKRIVDDVMEVASGTAGDVGAIDARAQVETVCTEWAEGHGMRIGRGGPGAETADAAAGTDGPLRLLMPTEPIAVRFDAEHLRRVLVNLLDNAHRHASGEPGAIEVRLESRHEAQAFLGIASDGAPIPAEVEPHLFEPFYSTRSRGTGLGLYICRELCERYGATIDYRVRGSGAARRNEFYVEMQRRPVAAS